MAKFENFLTGLKVFGTGLKAVSYIDESRDQAEAYAYNAEISKRNARLARQAGEFEAKRLQEQKEAATGEQVATFAKANVKLAGTPLDVLANTEYQFGMDIAATLHDASVRASALESEGILEQHRADMTTSKGRFDALSTILAGAIDLGFKSGLGKTKDVNKPKKAGKIE